MDGRDRGASQTQRGPVEAFRYLADSTDVGGERLGIALSGGGIRAACLGLGVLQVAEERGILERTRYVSAVSGGSYTATAFLASRAVEPRSSLDQPRPWSRGSSEERHLKRNLHYLVEDWADMVICSMQYVLGLVLNLVPLSAAVALVGTLLGIVSHHLGFLHRQTEQITATGQSQRWALAVLLLIVAAIVEVRTKRGAWQKTPRILTAGSVLLVVPDFVQLVVTIDRARIEYEVGLTQIGFAILLLISTLLLVVHTQWAPATNPIRNTVRVVVRAIFSTSWLTVLAVALAYATAYGVRNEDEYKAFLIALIAGALLVACGLFVHANWTSLHRPYASRLRRAYLVAAARDLGDRGGSPEIRLDDVELHDLNMPHMPELILCAAVNLRERESAHGEGCSSFIFSPTTVGSPALGYIKTQQFCQSSTQAVGTRLSSLMAASGAAVAPNMGRFTRKGSRFVLALMNFRLGLWLQNPFVPQPRPADPEKTNKIWRALIDGWYEPGPLASIQEALGVLSIRNQAFFISDGGHWDNSGIVELLRQRCSHIIAMDASNDPDRLGNVLRMLSLARFELGVEFDTSAALLESQDPVIRIRYRFPDDTPRSAVRYLVLMRTFVSPEMPADLIALSRSRPAFPRHSTMNQFFCASEFDGYIALGRWLAERAITLAELPPGLGMAAGRRRSRPSGSFD